ncbi:MAG: ISAs1 family transposase [Methylocella sp.]
MIWYYICFRPPLGRASPVIGPRAVDGKRNEIKAIPELPERLAINGAIVSIDAMATQKAIAAKIVEQEPNYAFAPKGNQSAAHDDVKSLFNLTREKSKLSLTRKRLKAFVKPTFSAELLACQRLRILP